MKAIEDTLLSSPAVVQSETTLANIVVLIISIHVLFQSIFFYVGKTARQ